MRPSLPASRGGFALILVLAFILPISVVTLTFFSKSILQRQISYSSANQAKVDLFAQGALETTIGDLRQEIADGSGVPVASDPNYWPITAATMVPYRTISTVNATSNPNLLKESAYNQPFYQGAPYTANGPSRAASSPSSGTSVLSRSVSAARWNESLLLPLQTAGSTSNFTPKTFTVPDWIYVDRSNHNPTAISTDIVGRYAYCIYDEGGLLDANVAGFPSAMPAANAAHKLGAPLADLTQIGLTKANVDQLVGWRNYASAQPTGLLSTSYTFSNAATLRYFNTILSDPWGFMNISSSTVFNGNTDQKFGSRQQLINFILQTLGAKSDTLQFLGTFSRAIDQPSFRPASGRPLIVAACNPPSPTSQRPYSAPDAGGNDAFGADDLINPSFLKVLVTKTFQRRDGTQAIVGEPLVKKRFALNRLCWITYEGPVAKVPAGDPLLTQLLNAGIPQQLIDQGTDANIASYFGLVWDSTNHLWSYGTGAAGAHTLGKLSDLQSQGREPDFFEMLKAGMVTGSLGKTSGNSDTSAVYATNTTAIPAGGDISQYIRDTSTNYHIIQIGANIIDQFDADSYPTHIYYDTRDFYGSENLPYLYRAHSLGLQSTSGTNQAAMLLLPEVWNPYDSNSPPGNPAITNFRFLLAGPTIWAVGATRGYPTPFIQTPPPGNELSREANPSTSASRSVQLETLGALPTRNGKTEIDFTLSDSKSAREPTFVGGIANNGKIVTQNGLSSSMPLSNNLIAFGLAPVSGYMKDGATGSPATAAPPTLSYMGVLLGTYVTTWTEGSGQNLITYPWPQTMAMAPPLQPTYWGNLNPIPCDECQTSSPTARTCQYEADYILQYQDQKGNWVTYQDNFAQIPLYSEQSVQKAAGSNRSRYLDITGLVYGSGGSFDTAQWLTWMDPRTSRFGGTGGTTTRTLNPTTVQANYYGVSDRFGTGYGMGCVFGTPGTGTAGGTSVGPSIGWYPGSWGDQNVTDGSTLFIPSYYSENVTGKRPAPQGSSIYFADPDGVVRRGMSGYVGTSVVTTTGMPLAALTNNVAPPQTSSRPYILNRPFQSVAELGYVFSGTPWRNLDFSTVESGAAPLLDVFCMNETPDPSALVAGKVNLNTRQPLVLQALLSGSNSAASKNVAGAAYKDELNAGTSGPTTELSDQEISQIALALTTRTTGDPSLGTGLGPLENVAELVGKWNKKVAAAGSSGSFSIDGSQSYVGFANDLQTVFLGQGGKNNPASDPSTINIQRMHESAVRALAAGGQTRVWNLLIDVVAQTGKYRTGETALDNLIVDGERRYWLHIAIDRFTGKVLDEQLEHVKE